LGAVTEPELAQVERAVYCDWKLGRARNADAAAITRVVQNTSHDYYENRFKEFQGLNEQFQSNPVAAVPAMKARAIGLRWLLGRLEERRADMGTYGFLDGPRRHLLIRLLGLDPDGLFTSRKVMQTTIDCLSAQFGAGHLSPALAAAALEDVRPG